MRNAGAPCVNAGRLPQFRYGLKRNAICLKRQRQWPDTKRLVMPALVAGIHVFLGPKNKEAAVRAISRRRAGERDSGLARLPVPRFFEPDEEYSSWRDRKIRNNDAK